MHFVYLITRLKCLNFCGLSSRMKKIKNPDVAHKPSFGYLPSWFGSPGARIFVTFVLAFRGYCLILPLSIISSDWFCSYYLTSENFGKCPFVTALILTSFSFRLCLLYFTGIFGLPSLHRAGTWKVAALRSPTIPNAIHRGSGIGNKTLPFEKLSRTGGGTCIRSTTLWKWPFVFQNYHCEWLITASSTFSTYLRHILMPYFNTLLRPLYILSWWW